MNFIAMGREQAAQAPSYALVVVYNQNDIVGHVSGDPYSHHLGVRLYSRRRDQNHEHIPGFEGCSNLGAAVALDTFSRPDVRYLVSPWARIVQPTPANVCTLQRELLRRIATDLAIVHLCSASSVRDVGRQWLNDSCMARPSIRFLPSRHGTEQPSCPRYVLRRRASGRSIG